MARWQSEEGERSHRGSDKGRRRMGSEPDAMGNKEENTSELPPKKRKMVWTDDLHSLFLDALRYYGLESAVPTNILRFMNVPGLRREHVASHLQKYRLFLQQVAKEGWEPFDDLLKAARNADSIFRELMAAPEQLFESLSLDGQQECRPSDSRRHPCLTQQLGNDPSKPMDYQSGNLLGAAQSGDNKIFPYNYTQLVDCVPSGVGSWGNQPNPAHNQGAYGVLDPSCRTPLFQTQNHGCNNSLLAGIISSSQTYNFNTLGGTISSNVTPGVPNLLLNSNTCTQGKCTVVETSTNDIATPGTGLTPSGEGLELGTPEPEIGMNLDCKNIMLADKNLSFSLLEEVNSLKFQGPTEMETLLGNAESPASTNAVSESPFFLLTREMNLIEDPDAVDFFNDLRKSLGDVNLHDILNDFEAHEATDNVQNGNAETERNHLDKDLFDFLMYDPVFQDLNSEGKTNKIYTRMLSMEECAFLARGDIFGDVV